MTPILDWGTAARIGSRLAGAGPPSGGADRARLREEMVEAVGLAEGLVSDLTGLSVEGPSTRPWVMSRPEWISRNLRSFEGVLRPLGERLEAQRPDGPLAVVRRKALGTQVGMLLGYVGRKVLGQYDLFLPPDDRDLLYFVGPNIVHVERRFAFDPSEFRLWISLHEVTHRIQFDGVPWLRGYVLRQIDEYLSSIDLDARRLAETLRRAVDEARRGRSLKGVGFISIFMTPEQRATFERMQAVMSLLEGHANHAMHALSAEHVPSAPRMRRVLQRRRQAQGPTRVFQKAIGFEAKASQYDRGERFVAAVVEAVGMEGFNRVWERDSNLPTIQEIARPQDWVQRVAAR